MHIHWPAVGLSADHGLFEAACCTLHSFDPKVIFCITKASEPHIAAAAARGRDGKVRTRELANFISLRPQNQL
jgi:hypothetical protein